MMLRLVLLLLLSATTAGAQATRPTTAPQRLVDGVLIISIDGLRPDVLLRAQAPHIRGLMDRGSFTMWAKTTPQSITLPSHVSMMTGVSPNVHGIHWNETLPLSQPVYPNVPTLFEVARRAGFSTAMVAGKSKMAILNVPGMIDHHWVPGDEPDNDENVARHAVQVVRDNRPAVMLVHFAEVDHVGHGEGWGTPQQLAAVSRADECVGKVLAAYNEVGTLDRVLIILTSDHGGAIRTHGPEDPRSRSIPWIAAGPGVRRNFDLTMLGRDVQTYDTFATACFALGLRPPNRIEGRAVVQIFQDAEGVQER
jgi:predicted AlkP superfamily pyrophosphatase or phosphodiesterase